MVISIKVYFNAYFIIRRDYMKVEKRNKSVVDFDPVKIENAIKKAMGESPGGLDGDLAKAISLKLKEDFSSKSLVNIEEIQDGVEVLLMKHRPDVAKTYILYREDRARLRDHGWDMSDLQRDIYEKKYRFKGESFEEFVERVSGGNSYIGKSIKAKKFLPAGRILAGRGLNKHGRKVTLSNCYVMPKVEDNIEAIFDTAKYLARTYSYGGGVGLSISKLRPKGARVNNAANTTTGAVSFMDLFSMVTGLIGMRGRRGALMLNMDSNHPDIEDFIDVKNDLSRVNFANISVNVDDEFMEAVVDNKPYNLYFKVDATGEEIKKTIQARDLFKKLAWNNWNMAEPGILYKNRIDSWHLMSEDKDFEFAGVNPCAEETLPAFGSCNLSSINLSEFVIKPFSSDAEFDFSAFEEMVANGVVYLNQVLDENMDLHPLKEQREMSRDYRQIGLGLMGLADMFIKMGISYGSDESLDLIDKIGHSLVNRALSQSALLAKEEGSFPKINKEAVLASPFLKENASQEVYDLVKKYGLRNSQILTIPPTGSISTLIGCSNGLEPIFQISYTRKSESLYNEDTYYKVFTPIIKELMDFKGITREEDLPDYVVTTSNLDYKNRIRVQARWQKYIDASISSTVNVPNDFSVEDVERLYIYAWEMGIKGITIYRDGCARAGVLFTDKPKENRLDRIDQLKEEIDRLAQEEIEENPNTCPMCSGELINSGGCAECLDCGYSPCSI